MRHPIFSHARVLVVLSCLAGLALLGGCAGTTKAPVSQNLPATRTAPPVAQAPITTPWPTRISPTSQQIQSFASLAPAVDRSIAHVARKPQGALAVDRPGARLTYGQLHQTLVTFRRILPELDRDPSVLGKYFKWVPIESDTLLTGYYEPTIEVSRTEHAPYVWPIYRNPGGAGKNYSREAIDYGKALRGRGLEIGYAKDPIDVFFLHVQGSGKLRYIEDGSTTYVLFNGKKQPPLRGRGPGHGQPGLLPPGRDEHAAHPALSGRASQPDPGIPDPEPELHLFQGLPDPAGRGHGRAGSRPIAAWPWTRDSCPTARSWWWTGICRDLRAPRPSASPVSSWPRTPAACAATISTSTSAPVPKPPIRPAS